jgi:hypothetical protein
MQATFNGRRIVVFSGGEAKDLEGLFTEIRGLRDGGANGSIIGRNTFRRPRDQALDMLDKTPRLSVRPRHSPPAGATRGAGGPAKLSARAAARRRIGVSK